jgi:hypothetical protein
MRMTRAALATITILASQAWAGQIDNSWRAQWPRQTMLAAWQRLKGLNIPGIPTDGRFRIAGDRRFVSPTGDDANPGTEDGPWRTLQKACAELKPNMVVYLKAGTYYGPATAWVQATESTPAAVRAVEGAEVVITYSEEWIKAEADQLVSVEPSGDIRNRAMGKDGQSRHYPGLLTLSGGFLEVSGLHFIGVRDRLPHNLYSENGVTLSGGTGYRVLYNEVENVGHCGVKAMDHGEHGFLIDGNFLHDLGQTQHDHGIYCPSPDGVIRRNLILNSTGYGIHAYSRPERIFISHNIVAGHAAYGIVLGGPDAKVYHNVVFGNREGGLFFFRTACRNAVVENNIFWGPGRAFGVDHDSGGNRADYNCIAPEASVATSSPAYAYGSHNFRADPLFVDAMALDFTLRPNSPCIEAGDPNVGAYGGKTPDIGLFGRDHLSPAGADR